MMVERTVEQTAPFFATPFRCPRCGLVILARRLTLGTGPGVEFAHPYADWRGLQRLSLLPLEDWRVLTTRENPLTAIFLAVDEWCVSLHDLATDTLLRARLRALMFRRPG